MLFRKKGMGKGQGKREGKREGKVQRLNEIFPSPLAKKLRESISVEKKWGWGMKSSCVKLYTPLKYSIFFRIQVTGPFNPKCWYQTTSVCCMAKEKSTAPECWQIHHPGLSPKKIRSSVPLHHEINRNIQIIQDKTIRAGQGVTKSHKMIH